MLVMLLEQTSSTINSFQNLFLCALNSEIFKYMPILFSSKSITYHIQEDPNGISNNLIKILSVFPPPNIWLLPSSGFDFSFLSDNRIPLCIFHVSSHHFSLKMNFIWGFNKNHLLWKKNAIIHVQTIDIIPQCSKHYIKFCILQNFLLCIVFLKIILCWATIYNLLTRWDSRGNIN